MFIKENIWLACQCVFAVYLAALAVMDIRKRKMSLRLLLSGFALSAFLLTVAISLGGREISWILIAGGIAVGAVFLLLSRITGEAFGYGDSILILVMGSFLGIRNMIYILTAAFTLAAAVSIVLLASRKFNRKSSFPFVPFLAAAYIGGMFFGIV